ncbi:M23 family metallopeptidase [Streptomyces sp. BV129]|uniref:M23 family metallopeptidase n=1 Tax=Streptomyces sp. BV129 TaxID=2849671 RepID=UPI0027E532EF|nr:M23 family metallopeptidase [Streptomyces sp. BV129]
MNDRHPSGTMTPAPASDASNAHYAPYGAPEVPYDDSTTYGGYDASGFPVGEAAYATDPHLGGYPAGLQATGAYDTTHWQTGDGGHVPHDPYAAQQHTGYDTGAYETAAWTVPAQGTHEDTGAWDPNAWAQQGQQPVPDPAQQWEWGTQTFDTGAYDATQWNTDGTAAEHQRAEEPFDQQATATFDQVTHDPYGDDAAYAEYADHQYDEHPASEDELTGTGEVPDAPVLLDDQEEVTPVPRAGSRAAARSRRRTPAKRSALLTVAVPSACVMGVAGIAAASVGDLTGDTQEAAASAADAPAVKPSVANSKLDTQLRTLSAGADDFTDRVSRTQERIDLKAQQALEKKKAAAEAALKERLRPKFAIPVAQKGLSAQFGQAGVNWMSVHTGIDFPVSYGTTVMAATDGVVTTKWNSAYGNMLVLTAKDGTETWYCHLSSYRVPSGTSVKAGEPVAYSGNSGNSTGPHLHFEVRPAGGAAVDPLPWLRSHGLDPT